MKEAFGGTFILKLIMVFFVVYVTFMGVALQIAKLYRIKNGVINILEQTQYSGGRSAELDKTQISTYLAKIPYNTTNDEIGSYCEEKYKYNGVCIVPGVGGNYYKVSVYYVAEFPFLGVHVPLTISGETMTIDNYNK